MRNILVTNFAYFGKIKRSIIISALSNGTDFSSTWKSDTWFETTRGYFRNQYCDFQLLIKYENKNWTHKNISFTTVVLTYIHSQTDNWYLALEFANFGFEKWDLATGSLVSLVHPSLFMALRINYFCKKIN